MLSKIKHFTEFKFFMSLEMKPHVNVALINSLTSLVSVLEKQQIALIGRKKRTEFDMMG